MNKEVNDLIPKAIEAIRKNLAEGSEVEKEYNGYVASLGASIIQSGLLPTLSFYTDVSDVHGKLTPGQRKNKLLKAIFSLIDQDKSESMTLLDYAIMQIDPNFKVDDASYPFSQYKPDKNKERIITRNIVNASLAIKLALRAFKLK